MAKKLSINQFRTITSSIFETYKVDMNDFAFTSLKRRIEDAINQNNFSNIDEFIHKIAKDDSFFNMFLYEISVEETEMFRDPSFWQKLKSEIFPKILNDRETTIWMPDITSGEELYTLSIVLKEAGYYENTKIIATACSERNIEFIKTGIYEIKKMQTNDANYNRYDEDNELSQYYTTNDGKAKMDRTLLENVEFIKHNIVHGDIPSTCKLVIFRNKMIYYNPHLQERVLNKIMNAILPGGYLAIGIKETINSSYFKTSLNLIVKEENIFKKITS